MKLILVRHGETDWNLKERIGGEGVPLNKEGIGQARKVGLRLKNERIDAIYSSDMKRAKQTAEEIAKFHGIPIVQSKLIRERAFGKLEGLTAKEHRELREASGLPKHLYRPPGGENYTDIAKRVREFLAQIRRKHGNENVIVVTHAAVIRSFINILAGKPLESIFDMERHENTAVSVIELMPGTPPKIHYLNSTEHL